MSAWQRLAPHAYAEWRSVGILIGLALIGIALEALLPWPLKLIIDHVLTNQPMPDVLSWLSAFPAAQSSAGLLAWLALGVFLVFLTSQILKLVKGVFETRLATRIQIKVGADAFARLQMLSLVYHRRAQKGDLVRRVTSDSNCLSTLVTGVWLPVVTSVLTLIVLFSIMWQLDHVLAVLAAVVAAPMAILMRYFAPRMAERAYEREEAAGQVWSVAEQTLTALPVVQAFGREAHERSRFSGVADRSARAYLRSLMTQIQFSLSINGCQALGVALIMLVGGTHVLQGSLSIGALIVFFSYLTALYAPLVAFAYLANTSASAMGSARRIIEVLDEKEEVQEEPRARRLAAPSRGHVRMEGIVFGYQPGKPVLQSVDFEAHAGETVAIVGATGAGKTSLVSLIPRLFDPWAGRVLIDEQDVRSAKLASVRASVSFVLQDPFILPLTIAQNIAYARPTASAADIEAAARIANAHEFIERLDHGYDTAVGERGVTLSAGQRQRLAIARAVLKNAPILIMDEPTSALDVVTEELVLEALDRLLAGRTAIIIAHRLSTIRRADRVVVLDHGQVAQPGSHEELLASGGLYRTLYLGQMLHVHSGTALPT